MPLVDNNETFFAGGGQLGGLMRSHDWSTSALGMPATWPQPLRSVVGLLLNSKFPMFIAWGTHLGFLYNDAYAEILGDKHPCALGRPFVDVWSEIWSDISPLVDAALAGEATYREDLPLKVNRQGHEETAFFTFSYSPVRGEDGAIAGMFCVVAETSETVRSGMRRDALLELDDSLPDVSNTADLSFTASKILGEALGASRVGYGTVDAEAGTIHVERHWSAPGFDDLAGTHRFDDYGTYIDDLRQGRPVANVDVAADPRTAANADAFRAIDIRAHLDVPVVENGRTVGQIFVHSPVPRRWSDSEVAFVRDFAERTRAAIARREAEVDSRRTERELQHMADSLPVLVSYVDRDETYRFVNQAYQEWFGLRPDELIGRSLREIIGDPAYVIAKPNIDRVLAGEAFSFEQHMPYRAGGERWIYVDYVPRLDEAGTASGFYAVVQDITERKRAEQHRIVLVEVSDAIRDAENLGDLAYGASAILGRILGVSRVGYGTIDHDAETLHVERDWNAPSATSLAGVLALRDFGSFVDSLKQGELISIADVREDPRTAVAAGALESRSARSFVNLPVLERDRLQAVLYVNHDAVREWGADEIALITEVADRTRTGMERLRAEERLRSSEARLHELNETLEQRVEQRTAERDRLWELSPDLLTVVDYDGRLLRVNPSWTRVLGYDENRLLTRPYVEILHPEEIESIAGVLAEMKESGRPVLLEDRLLAADGSWRTFVWTLSPEPGGEQIYGVGRDVTEERAQAQALAQRTGERDRLWTLSQDMLARADYSGMMSAVSPAWTKILGWSESELLSRSYATFMHPEDMPSTLEAIERMAKTSEPSRFENRIATRDENWRHIEWTVAPEPDGLNFIAVGRDLSLAKAREAELAAAQEALRQSQKMEAMGSLTGGVAHDFNNLLTPIVGALDMLQRNGVGTEREQRLIAGAVQSADRAKTLVQRLLAFARRQPLQAGSVDLGPLVKGMADLVSSTTGPQIKVVVDAADGLPPAKADPNQLEMAILNLAVNARDAMPEGGTLRISVNAETVEHQHRTDLRPGKYLQLSVADTGTGMDAETLGRAIEPFFSTKGVGKGTGLGLSMVHGLASQLGGSITIQSSVGIGTNVELWLPQSAEPLPDAGPIAAEQDFAKASGTALLVDDEDTVRLSTADMLIDLGYVVVEATSGEEALRLFNDGLRPDVLVTDHLMPGITGTELARTLQSSQPGIKVLIVSGYAEADGVAPDLPRLTKPFRHGDLAASLAVLD